MIEICEREILALYYQFVFSTTLICKLQTSAITIQGEALLKAYCLCIQTNNNMQKLFSEIAVLTGILVAL